MTKSDSKEKQVSGENRQAKRDTRASQNDCLEAKNAFICNVSHEIRTPMNAIMGFAQMLKQTGLDAQQGDYVDVILDSGNKLLMILENLLDLSNLQLKKVHLSNTECDIYEKVQSMWSHFRQQIMAKNLQPILELQDDMPRIILDCEKMERVMGSILSNALKFTSAGSIKLKVGFTPGDKRSGILEIHVVDTGCGIEEEQIKHIFEAFVQADNSVTRQYSGMGLGLGLSSKIVSLMGGEICASSQVGVGSDFHITIPVKIV